MIIVILVHIVVSATSQQTQDIRETVHLHLNSNTFISGENLRYSGYCRSEKTGKLSRLSRIVYVELVGKDGVVDQQKISLEAGRGNGSLFISSLLSSGTYQLIAYTRWMQNFDRYFQAEINIVNPFEKYPTITDSDTLRYDSIGSELDTYGTRQLVRLPLKLKKGTYSISVRKKDNLFPTVTPAPQIATDSVEYVARVDHLPEFREALQEGRIWNANRPAANAHVGMTTMDDSGWQLRTAIADSTGRFTIPYISPNSSSEAYFTTIPPGNNATTIRLKSNFLAEHPSINYEAKPLAKSKIAQVADRSMLAQLRNVFEKSTRRMDSVHWATQINYTATYRLDDFKRFETLNETFVEYIPEVFVRKRSENPLLVYTEPGVGRISNPTLILMNGIPVEVTKMLSFDPYLIETIEVLNKRFYLGPAAFDGVINFTPKEGYLDAFGFDGYLQSTIGGLERGSSEEIVLPEDPNVPDVRNQLYWNPKLNIETDELLWTLSYTTSDIEGVFEVEIQGVLADGTPFSRVEEIKVIDEHE